MANEAHAVRDRVREFVATNGLLGRAGMVLVGFSGGADSTACLLLLAELAENVVAVHLHHGLRGTDADRDAAWCEAFCVRRGIVFECRRLDVPGRRLPGEGVEEAARRCRLAFWRDRATPDATVALGHHLDDRLEGLIMRLARGANAGGLTGLRPERTVCGVRMIRPLLCCRRAELEDFLRREGVEDWCEDRTNADTRLLRNAVRHEWLPMLRDRVGHDAGLMHSLRALADDADFLETAAAAALPDTPTLTEAVRLHPALLPRVLRLWLTRELDRDTVLGAATIDRVRDTLRARPSKPVHITASADLTLVVDRGAVRIKHAPGAVRCRRWAWRSRRRLDIPEASCALTAEVREDRESCADGNAAFVEDFDAGLLPDELIVRAWGPGDRMVPFGSRSEKKVQDIFVDARVPREHRRAVPVVAAAERIIWLAGVRRAEFARVSPTQPASVVRLRCHRLDGGSGGDARP